MATMITRGPARFPEGVTLPAELRAGPIVSLWAEWERPGVPVIANPLERLQYAKRRWSAAGELWSRSFGCHRSAWVSLLPAETLAAVSVEGWAKAEQLARARLPAPR